MALEFASRKATFPNYRKFETTFAGRPFVVETGKLCGLANGSAMIRYGETCVLCNVTMSEKPREGVDFFPLSVEFEEKLYAAGRIPGSFMRREGRPGEHAILSSRVVDRHPVPQHRSRAGRLYLGFQLHRAGPVGTHLGRCTHQPDHRLFRGPH